MLAYCHIAITALVPPNSHNTISPITGCLSLNRDKRVGPTHDGFARKGEFTLVMIRGQNWAPLEGDLPIGGFSISVTAEHQGVLPCSQHHAGSGENPKHNSLFFYLPHESLRLDGLDRGRLLPGLITSRAWQRSYRLVTV